jgi:hypothetical protein
VTPEATASEAVTAKAAKAASPEAAMETASVEASAPVTAKSPVSECQGIGRDCRGAKQTGRSERDSNLAQHDTTLLIAPLAGRMFCEGGLRPNNNCGRRTDRQYFELSNIDFQLIEFAEIRYFRTSNCVPIFLLLPDGD